MPLIEWQDDFNLGVPEIDYEHRRLVALINALHETFRRSRADAADFIGELHARISAHFALEERVMRESGFERYRRHKEDHERLLEELRELMDALDAGAPFDETALGRRLHDWFTEHFQTEDARLHRRDIERNE